MDILALSPMLKADTPSSRPGITCSLHSLNLNGFPLSLDYDERLRVRIREEDPIEKFISRTPNANQRERIGAASVSAV